MGNRTTRRDTWLRRLSSRVANGVRGWLLKDGTPDTGCGIKVFDRAVFMDMPRFKHMHRFMPALFQREGYEVDLGAGQSPRAHPGQSKYGLHNRLWVGIVDLFGVMWLIRRASPRVADRPRKPEWPRRGAPRRRCSIACCDPGANAITRRAIDVLWLVGLASAADRRRSRTARSVAGRRAALRARGAGHAALRRLADSARRRRPLRRQAAALLLADGGRHGASGIGAHRFPAAIAARGPRHRRCSCTTCCAACAAAKSRFAGALRAAAHVPVRLAGAAGADRRDAVLLHDAEPVRAAAPPVRRARRSAGSCSAGRPPASA